MPERHERALVRWHCAKVKGHAELKIEKPRVKTLSYDFPKLHHSKPNSFCANVHLRQSFWKTVKVMWRHTKVKVSKFEGAPMVPLCLKFGAIPTTIYKVRTIPVFKHTLAPSEKWPTQEISVRSGPFLSSYRVNIARCNLCARAKVKGHIKLKIEENTSVGKLAEPFQIW